MMRVSTTLGIVSALALSLGAASARADCPYGYEDVMHHCSGGPRGFEISLHGGVGGHFNDSSTAFQDTQRANNHLFWPGFGGQLWMGARPISWLSFGAHLAYQNNPARDLPAGTTGGQANTFAAGVYARAYLGSAAHWRYFDPWLGVGVDPFAGVWAQHDTPIGQAQTRIYTVAIPMSLGLDVNVTRHVALGLMAQASPWIPWQLCSDSPVGTTMCTNDHLATNWYFYAGAGARFTLGR